MTPPFSRIRAQRLALAVAATLLATGVAWYTYQRLRGGPRESVLLVDHRKEVASLLEMRARTASTALQQPSLPNPADPPPLVSERIPQEIARYFFPLSGLNRPYSDKFYFARPPNMSWWTEWPEHPLGGYEMRSNSLGWREDDEPKELRPDLRIMITGDSHTDGVCGNSESFPNRLGSLLESLDPKRSVEVLNSGIGGYNFWNYLGVLEHYAPILKPHVFVIACYGGNDFYETLGLERYFNKRKAPVATRLPEALLSAEGTGFVSQELLQAGMMLSNPADEAIAISTANAITREMKRIADENGVKLIALYIPPPSIGDPVHTEEELARLLALTDWSRDDLSVAHRLADGWLGWCANHEIQTIDLRDVFRNEKAPLYWQADRHLNLHANDLVAAVLSRAFVEAR